MTRRQTTGNLWFVLPRIAPPPDGVRRVAFLMMRHRGLIELTSGDDQPLILGDVRVNGRSAFVADSRTAASVAICDEVDDWIPRARAEADGVHAALRWLTPIDERGVVARIDVDNHGAAAADIEFIFAIRWGQTLVSTYDSEPLEGCLRLDPDAWGGGVALAWCTARTEFALGVGRPLTGSWQLTFERADGGIVWCGEPHRGPRGRQAPGVCARLEARRSLEVAAGAGASFEIYLSVAQDCKASSFDTRTLRETGWERLYARTRRRLAELNANVPAALDAHPHLGPLVRRNRLFCLFYSLGRTLDTEEICPVTSRSSDYYVSAAYWDRDALLWSFPCVLDMDAAMAAEMLRVAFGRQGRNIGIHSRFIDGSIYEPGFELDELLAPLLALDRYIERTGDWSIVEAAGVGQRLPRIERELEQRKHPTLPLVSTEYLPTDDLDLYPYCIYDNVLLWRACGVLERLLPRIGRAADAAKYGAWAQALKAAIYKHGVIRGSGAARFAWSVDLEGGQRSYDEPPGSLLLLPWHGFCAADDPIWRATLAWVYSTQNEHYFAQCDEIGCKHAEHPWVLAIANSLLTAERRGAALRLLSRATMDDGLACESIDEHTGAVKTGGHFATCAGFLCHALCEASRDA